MVNKIVDNVITQKQWETINLKYLESTRIGSLLNEISNFPKELFNCSSYE